MMEELEGVKQSGKFRFAASGKDLHGELTLAGSKTSIYLQDSDFFDSFPKPRRYITGALLDLTRVTLIDCITMSGTGTAAAVESDTISPACFRISCCTAIATSHR